jgi:hypothetical protein
MYGLGADPNSASATSTPDDLMSSYNGGGSSSNGMSQMMQMLLMQQAMQSAGQLGQTAPIQANNFAQYANPQAQVMPGQGAPAINPAMLGMILSGSR